MLPLALETDLLLVLENIVVPLILGCPWRLAAPQSEGDPRVSHGDDGQGHEVLDRHQRDPEIWRKQALASLLFDQHRQSSSN